MDKQKLIYGEFQYKDNVYPFVIDGHIMTVVQQAFHYSSDFSDVEQIDELIGVTNSNQYIMMLGCRCISNGSLILTGRVQFSILGYIIYNNEEVGIDRLVFSSPALNALYSPKKAWHIQDEMLTSITDVQISFENANKVFTISLPSENIQCELGFFYNLNYKLEKSEILTIQTQLSMTFSEPKPLKSVKNYYLYMLDFLTFANFEQDIPIEHIYLFSNISNGEVKKNGGGRNLSKRLQCVHP